jgi:hypothetical protein
VYVALLQGRDAKAAKDSTASTLSHMHRIIKTSARTLPDQSSHHCCTLLYVALLQGRDAKAVKDSTASTLPHMHCSIKT